MPSFTNGLVDTAVDPGRVYDTVLVVLVVLVAVVVPVAVVLIVVVTGEQVYSIARGLSLSSRSLSTPLDVCVWLVSSAVTSFTQRQGGRMSCGATRCASAGSLHTYGKFEQPMVGLESGGHGERG